jgi:hypothetical protein
MSSFSEADLRAMVREALGDLMPQGPAPTTASAPAMNPMPVTSGPSQEVSGFAISETVGQVETVSIGNDAELHTFVMKIIHLVENPKTRDDLRQGKLRFSLGGHTQASSAQPSHRIERGAVTESIVKRAATAGATLVLSPEAVLTPLARDRARALGVTIEKEQP